MRKNQPIPLLCLILAMLWCGLPMAALADDVPPTQLLGAQLIDLNDHVTSIAWHEGTLHILSNQGYLRWQPGQDAAIRLPDAPVGQRSTAPGAPEGVDALLLYKDSLLGLDTINGVLHDITVTDTGFTIAPRLTLAWDQFLEGEAPYQYITQPAFVNIVDDTLLVRVDNWDNKAVDLYGYDLETGQRTEWPVTNLFDIVPYKDNRVLAIHYNQNDRDESGMSSPAKLVTISLDDHQVIDIPLTLAQQGRHGVGGTLPLYYDAASDTILVRNQGELTSLADPDKPAVTANLPMGDSYTRTVTPSILKYRDDLVFVAAQTNVFISSTDPNTLTPITSLRTNTSFLNNITVSKAMLLESTVRVAPEMDGGFSQEMLLTQLMSGQADVDLLQMDARGFDIQQMIKKGYLADLSASPAIADMVRDALPPLAAITQWEGGVYTIPLSYQPAFLEVNLEVFEQMGRDVPTTIPELIDLARWWGEEGHETVEDVVLFDMHSAKALMKTLAFESYKASLLGRGLPLVFDMERFGSIMQDIDALNTESWDLPANYGSGDDDDEYLGMPAITPYAGYNAEYTQTLNNKQSILLQFDADMPAMSDAFTYVVGVAANSPNRDAAIRFLEAYVQSMDPLLRATLSISWSDPVVNPRYEFELEQAQSSLTQFEAQLDKAEGAHRTELENTVKLQREGVEEIRTSRQFLITAEQLQAHRKMMESTYVEGSLSRLANEALSRDGYMLHMYLDGALTLEQFVKQANDKIRLMTLEAQ